MPVAACGDCQCTMNRTRIEQIAGWRRCHTCFEGVIWVVMLRGCEDAGGVERDGEGGGNVDFENANVRYEENGRESSATMSRVVFEAT